jgi:hypothetical protein
VKLNQLKFDISEILRSEFRYRLVLFLINTSVNCNRQPKTPAEYIKLSLLYNVNRKSFFLYFRTPLSNAERQWRWRERQKQKGEENFFRKEAKRKRGSYVPVDDLNTSVKKKRREEGRKRSQKWYEKKENKNTEDNENEHGLGTACRATKQKGLLSNCLHIKHQQKEDLYA